MDESSEKWREATKAGIFEKHQSFNGAFSDKNGRSLSPARAAITSPGSFEGHRGASLQMPSGRPTVALMRPRMPFVIFAMRRFKAYTTLALSLPFFSGRSE